MALFTIPNEQLELLNMKEYFILIQVLLIILKNINIININHINIIAIDSRSALTK
jgi:hypothetical protein